jgi:acyl-CoA reductase-like NAD-dependent aldehyde dehydrogenase
MGAILVLEGAPVETVASAALWAAFAAGGRHPAAAGRLVVVPSLAEPLLGVLRERAARLEVGDPTTEHAEIGPLRSAEDLAAVEALVDEAVAGGAELVCGGTTRVEGLAGAFYAPAVLRRVPSGARILREPVPGPVLAVVEAPGEAAAIALVQDGPPREHPHDRRARGGVVSIWAGDRAKGERVARTLQAELIWVNEHGAVAPGPALRLQRHVAPRQVASRTAQIGGARRLPYDPGLVRARTAAARLVHGREADRLRVLRRDAGPLARAALRVGAGLLRQR